MASQLQDRHEQSTSRAHHSSPPLFSPTPSSLSKNVFYNRPHYYPREVNYVVCQVLDKHTNIVLNPQEENVVKSEAPALLTINADSNVTFSGPEGTLRDLCVGQHTQVSAFALKIVNGILLDYDTYYQIDIPTTLRKNGGTSTAIVAYGKVDPSSEPRILWLPAVLTVPVEANVKDRRPIFVSRYHLSGCTSRPYQYLPPPKDLQPGELVWSKQIHIEPGSQVGTNFILPRRFRQQPETERITDEVGTSYLSMLYLDFYGPLPFPCNPFAAPSHNYSLDRQLRWYEDILLAVNAYLRRKAVRVMAGTKYVGSACRRDETHVKVYVSSTHNRLLLAQRLS